ncbi:MAG: hypothetical protein DRR08_23885 [Candidatus Parabeggiatoa sp. nov. 2]|nr:MAG: hypothetical protein B6247_14010 [Beggiatoa sp. 4572_84]RKZ55584.1 MAG: hypothetical protein DRR08_23885 [Gammaproteobacteria bacterium]
MTEKTAKVLGQLNRSFKILENSGFTTYKQLADESATTDNAIIRLSTTPLKEKRPQAMKNL